MSLDGLRDAYIREKKNEIATCERARKRKLRELYYITSVLSAAGDQRPQPAELPTPSDEPSETERAFLDANDIAQGLRFDDSTLPYPITQYAEQAPLPSTLPFQPGGKPAFSGLPNASPSPGVGAPAASLEEQLRAASASPCVGNQAAPTVLEPVAPASPASVVGSRTQPPHVEPIPHDGARFPQSAAAEESQPRTQLDALLSAAETSPVQPPREPEPFQKEAPEDITPDGPSADPKLVVPPSAEDSSLAPREPSPAVVSLEESKPPQVVHLPSQEVQEERLQETERRLEQARVEERKEEQKLSLPVANAPADLNSSPSSTVGPYSQATPHATHQSPDTSPDRESFTTHIPPAAQEIIEPDPAARQAKEEHERALQQQMQEARERARGESSATPEVERQLEEEQAIRMARDGRSVLSEPEPADSLTNQAQASTHEVLTDLGDAENQTSMQKTPADSLPTPTTTAPEHTVTESGTTADASDVAQESTISAVEHPTPPADADVEMDDAPSTEKVQLQIPQQLQPPLSDSQRATTPLPSRESPQKSVEDVDAVKAVAKPMLTPHSSTISASSVSPMRTRSRDQVRKEVSTVIFAKQEPQKVLKALQRSNPEYASLLGASEDTNRDYLEGLFRWQAHQHPRSETLGVLLSSARKTLSTGGFVATLRESQDYKILKRVYQLQNANRWSFRQLRKSMEPPRPATHLDHLLKEMKWMQVDFKEERKWKMALAATFAHWCAEYVNSDREERASLRIRARVPARDQDRSVGDEEMADAPTPDLVHSGANETESESYADDEESYGRVMPNAFADLFSMGFNDVVMKIDPTPASDAMLLELPLYEPNLEASSDVTPVSFLDPPILPVSKFVTGKIVTKVSQPPRKRSRYEYDSEDESGNPPSRSGTSAEHSMPSTPGRRLFHRNDLPPEMTDVALFHLENKHIRDRLYAGHQFKPPAEFPMPSVSFFESRQSSQWLWEEDQKLRTLVKDYSFNWSLVAQELALPSIFVSGSGRRTPWECFERWMLLEGLPSDMGKLHYFKTYMQRLEQAQKTVAAEQQQMLQQQAQQGQNVSGQVRKRSTQPIRVERRRENRHLAFIDAMRKLARKREQQAHKQAESQKAAALRKAHDQPTPTRNMHTPQEFSRMKWEKEEKRKQLLQLQQENAMRAMAAQRQASMQGMQGQMGIANGVAPPQRNGTPGGNLNVPSQMPSVSAQPGHAGNPNMAARQQHPAQQGLPASFPNGNLSGISMNTPSVPQAQMQTNIPGNQRMAPPDQVRMAMQRAQYPNTNQHQFQLQQQQINMASNITANMNMGNNIPNANMMASIAGQNMNGNMNAPLPVTPNSAGSPRMNQLNSQMQSPARPLSSGHMPHLLQIQNSLKAQHPDWPPEQIQKQASDHLQRILAKQRAQAMNAAAGAASGITSSPQLGNNVYLQNGGMQNSPSPNPVQSYQTQLLQQQRMMNQRQQQAGSPAMSARPMSRSATPQNPQQLPLQSPGGAHQGRS